MPLRITCVDDESGTRLCIDGRLGRDGLGELRRAHARATKPHTIDLSGLRLADDAALEALGRLESGGARLVGASQYLALRLQSRKPRVGKSGAGNEKSC